MFFLNTSDALDVYLDGLVINLSSLFTSKSATNALWIDLVQLNHKYIAMKFQ